MIRRLFLVFSALALSTQFAHAEAQRATLTRENRFPEVGKGEIGSFYEYREYNDGDSSDLRPYARYTVIQNLTLNASVPYVWVQPDDSNSDADESGFGDASVGIELLAYQDIFEYPWVIPHLDASFSTGDEDKGLGSGETVTKFGVSVGTTVYDVLHYILDVSYAINGGKEQTNPDNVTIVSGSLVWDISKKFAVLAEARVTDENTQNDEVPVFYNGGMSYKFTDNLQISWYGGASHDGGERDEKLLAAIKVAYSF